MQSPAIPVQSSNYNSTKLTNYLPCQHRLSQAPTPSTNSGHHWQCMAREHPLWSLLEWMYHKQSTCSALNSPCFGFHNTLYQCSHIINILLPVHCQQLNWNISTINDALLYAAKKRIVKDSNHPRLTKRNRVCKCNYAYTYLIYISRASVYWELGPAYV